MTDLSPRAAQLLDDARASRPRLEPGARQRVRRAVLLSVAGSGAAAAGGATAFTTTLLGKVAVGVAAAIVGAVGTVAVVKATRLVAARAIVVP